MFGYIYKTTIKNKESSLDGCYYIGKRQKSEFDKNYYGSGKILKDYKKKYKNEGLYCEILERADSLEELNELEKKYISKFINDDRNINIASGGIGGNVMFGMSEELKNSHKRKLSEAQKIRWSKMTELEKSETVKKMIKNRVHWGNSGKKFSEEWKKKQSDGMKRYCNSKKGKEEIKKRALKVSEKYKDENFRNKISESRKKIWENPEYRKKRSEIQRKIMKKKLLSGELDNFRFSQKGKEPWNKGIKLTEEYKKKISDSHKGKKLSEETKEKLRQRAIEQWKRQKGIKRKEKNERK